ncbi:hypothetical protein [Nitrospira lenta]|uniref:C-type lectin domain-containing protein n=1 Tax=Nitrospira lenta TaxID=1436998 RepID=A0A330L0R9_9BACT|nr:hypothetical protein [Nitrospira lenta]SPP63244.1 exported hypothetical protein [Nitrospira lenta]
MPSSPTTQRRCRRFFGAAILMLGLIHSGGPALSAEAEYLPICNLPKCLNPQVTTKSGIGTANATAEARISPDDAAKWCAAYKPRDKYCAKEQVQSGWIGFRPLYRASADCLAGRLNGIDGGNYSYVGVWGDGPGKGRPRFRAKGDAKDLQWEGSGATVDHTGTFLSWGGGSANLATQWDVLCAGAPAPAAH